MDEPQPQPDAGAARRQSTTGSTAPAADRAVGKVASGGAKKAGSASHTVRVSVRVRPSAAAGAGTSVIDTTSAGDITCCGGRFSYASNLVRGND